MNSLGVMALSVSALLPLATGPGDTEESPFFKLRVHQLSELPFFLFELQTWVREGLWALCLHSFFLPHLNSAPSLFCLD